MECTEAVSGTKIITSTGESGKKYGESWPANELLPFKSECPYHWDGTKCSSWVGFETEGEALNTTNISCVRIAHSGEGLELAIEYWGGDIAEWVTESVRRGVRKTATFWLGNAPYAVRLRPLQTIRGPWRLEEFGFYETEDCSRPL